jgi:hypothetical protein
MRLKRLAIAAAIIPTLGFACYNEPHYPTTGMSNGPAGSGSGITSVTYGGPPAGAVAGAAAAPAASKGPAKK